MSGIKFATIIAATLIAASLYNLQEPALETGLQATPSQMVAKMQKVKRLSSEQTTNANLIMNECAKYGSETDKLAYVLATAYHEANLRPIKEYKAKVGSSHWNKYQSRYWNTGFYGRGFVQLTWDYNYKKYSSIVGQDLVRNPDLVLQAGVAAKIICHGMFNGAFTGKSLKTYFYSGKQDWYNARRIINGTYKASEFAATGQAIYKA